MPQSLTGRMPVTLLTHPLRFLRPCRTTVRWLATGGFPLAFLAAGDRIWLWHSFEEPI
jgi:hypothetical protein